MNTPSLTSKIRELLPKKPLDIVLYALFIIAIVKLASLYGGVNEDDGNWNEFKAQHNCQLKKSGEGNIQSAWECDDGKTYYRWRQLKS
jgi:hypothetical protein